MANYQRPDWMTRNIVNPIIASLTRLGLSMRGSRVLAVRGRKSGEWRTVPVNPLTIDSGRYLVAPRGETQWVRNMRASREGELRLGSKREVIRVEEVDDDAKPEILREYLRRWKMETSKFFGGVDDSVAEADLRRIAPDHPVFRIL